MSRCQMEMKMTGMHCSADGCEKGGIPAVRRASVRIVPFPAARILPSGSFREAPIAGFLPPVPASGGPAPDLRRRQDGPAADTPGKRLTASGQNGRTGGGALDQEFSKVGSLMPRRHPMRSPLGRRRSEPMVGTLSRSRIRGRIAQRNGQDIRKRDVITMRSRKINAISTTYRGGHYEST